MTMMRALSSRYFVAVVLSPLIVAAFATRSEAVVVNFQEAVSPTGAYNVNDTDVREGSPTTNTNGADWNVGNFSGRFRELVKYDLLAGGNGVPTNATITS